MCFFCYVDRIFFNNYAAACLGDSEFYDNFDRLSELGKFQLISKFILKKDIDKSRSYYSNLKILVKYRDTFVHNKSRDASCYGTTLEKINASREYFDQQILKEGPPMLDKSEIKKDFEIARISIKALKDIADFFEEADYDCFASFFLLNKEQYDSRNKMYFDEVIKEFGT